MKMVKLVKCHFTNFTKHNDLSSIAIHFMVTFEETKQQRKLAELRKKEEEERVKILASKYKIPYQDLSTVPIDTDALKVISESDSRKGELAVVQRIGKNLQIGVKNPETLETRKILEDLKRQRYTFNLFLVSRHSIERVWEMYKLIPKELGVVIGEIRIIAEKIIEFQKAVQSIESIQDLLKNIAYKSISDALEVIIAGALSVGASDVHIEPQDDVTRLRLRLDGVLHDIMTMPSQTYKFLLSRIKLVSTLKVNIKDRGQDGRFTIKLPDTQIEVRVSTLPGPYGENVVMRILDPKTISLALEELGMQPWVEKLIAEEIQKPNGMILTTGPTGSGKTTTLYAFLKKVHSPDTKIITLEDPIEYHLKGIEQTQVDSHKGYDFASGLRSILRQDPDIILVGEIRDLETASTAMHASLTGHLVFSTLHTNDAAGTIPRLVDIGVKPNIIAPAINVAMAQRLARRLCKDCKISRPFNKKEIQEITEEVEKFPKGVEKPDIKKMQNGNTFAASDKGCPKCHNTGYKGRIGLYEILLVDDAIENLILKSPSVGDVRTALHEQGQITMKQDGVLKVLAGITDLQEVKRIVG